MLPHGAAPIRADDLVGVCARAAAVRDLPDHDGGEKILAELEVKLTRLGVDFADGIIDQTTLRAATETIRARQSEVREQVSRRTIIADFLDPSIIHVVQWWEKASKRRQRDVISVLLDHVTVKPAVRSGRRRPGDPLINPDRLTRVWKTA